MATRAELIVRAIVDALSEPVRALPPVYRDRGISLAAANALPAIDVIVERDDMTVMDLGDVQLDHVLRVDVAVWARGGIDSAPSREADAVLAVAYRALMQSAEIAALAYAITPGPLQSRLEPTGDGLVVRVSMIYAFEFATAVDDLEAVP